MADESTKNIVASLELLLENARTGKVKGLALICVDNTGGHHWHLVGGSFHMETTRLCVETIWKALTLVGDRVAVQGNEFIN